MGPKPKKPGVPEGFKAIVNNGQVELKWNPVPSAKRYIIGRATNPQGPNTVLTWNCGPSQYVDSPTSDDATYYYSIIAVNDAGRSDSHATTDAILTK